MRYSEPALLTMPASQPEIKACFARPFETFGGASFAIRPFSFQRYLLTE